MNLFGKDNHPPGPDLTEDIFLQTLATRICEMMGYDIDEIDQLKNAISNLHSRQVKSGSGSHQKDLDFYTALQMIDPGYAKIVESAQKEIVSTLRQTHNDRNRQQIYRSLQAPNSATFGQEISQLIGQEMVKQKTGTRWDG